MAARTEPVKLKERSPEEGGYEKRDDVGAHQLEFTPLQRNIGGGRVVGRPL